MLYFTLKGKEYPVHNDIDITELDEDKIKKNHVYMFDGDYYILRGNREEYDSIGKSGIYISEEETEDETTLLIELLPNKSNGKTKKLDTKLFHEFNGAKKSNQLDNIISRISQMNKNNNKKPKKIKLPVNNKVERVRQTPFERTCRQNIINYAIKDEDEDFVKILKEVINESNVTLEDLYDFYDERTGYNMYYGLLKRTSVTEVSIGKWCEFLGYDYCLTLRKL
jgi:hypothetical protein